jgi:amidase
MVLLATAGGDAQRASSFNVHEATIADIQRALQAKRITTVGVVEQYLRRIKAYNGPCWGFDARKARSMTDRADSAADMPDALETAAAQDGTFARSGRLVGPLHGVVIAIKDQYDTRDMRTTSGADAQYANDRPPDDATFVTKLRNAGAIIIAKANLAEYAVDGARSSFGGTFCNPYDTEREPGMSSAGSATAVAANLVTCAIGEETVVSVRWPAAVNSIVGLAPTKELVSTDGMMGAGLNMRVGPMCRTVADTARILDVIAGYDPKDEYTALSVGRTPRPLVRRSTGEGGPYLEATNARSLAGLRIGVVREYLNRKLLAQADAESVDLVERAIEVLTTLGATVVDPGPEGALFQQCIVRSAPELLSSAFARQYRQLFPVNAAGQPEGDHIATLVELRANPSRVPDALTLRTLGGGFAEPGEDKYMMNRYLRERGDANIKTNADLIAKASFYNDPNFPNRRAAREQAERATALDTSTRMHTRFAAQTLLMNCMEEQTLDALVAPMSTVPPRKLLSPREPASNGRTPIGWFMFGQQGFPVIDVPAGFTTTVWDRERIGTDTRLVGPLVAKLPVGVDFIARPFGEPVLFRIAAAYEAATKNRRPPDGFGPVR